MEALGDNSYPDLPVSKERKRILSALESNQVIVVVGDTGSGKTTQLPKMALELANQKGLKHGRVGCTQPRRIAAASVSKRVAEELSVRVGEEVGYHVRFQETYSKQTKLKFMTDGILLAETQGDPMLKQYHTIIIDEAHERSLNIDFLLGYLKSLLKKRRDLKVVISSATMDAGSFSEFFGGAPVVNVEGRTFPVETHYLPRTNEEDLPRHISRALEWISKTDALGDVLVFLPGEREIRECADVLEGRNWRNTEILALFARLGLQEQQRVFQPQEGKRRVVLATNVAETSLTIPGIVYVIDTGTARVNRWNPARQIQRLQIEKISQASARQRKGRCGRVSEGICVRLYEEDDFLERPEYTDPEIRRSSLAGVILRMKALRLPEISEFPFLNPPSSKHISEGYRTLREIGALDEIDELTNMGRDIARLPVEPRLARILLEAQQQRCLPELLVIVSGLSVMDPRERPAERQKEADEAQKIWNDKESDFMSILHMWTSLTECRSGGKWQRNQLRKLCKNRYLNFRRVLEWDNLRRELTSLGRDVFHWPKQELAPKSTQWASYEVIHKTLLTGMPKQIGLFERKTKSYKATQGGEFAIFPGSGVFGQKRIEWILAFEMVDTSRLWARRVAAIQPEWVEEVAPHLCRKRYHSASWDKGQGAVYGKENIQCGQLTLIANRKVHYGRVDAKLARSVMIRDGLLVGEIKGQFAFSGRVKELREEVASMEQKLLRVDGIWSDEALLDFVEKHLPDYICTEKSLKKWLSKKNHETLFLPSLSDVIYEDTEELALEDYPDELSHGEDTYTLYYNANAGDWDYGVTIALYLDQLGSLPSWLPSWGVPGRLEERALLLIRSLPKAQRVACHPVAQSAEAFASEWLGKAPSGEMLDRLAEFLQQKTGMPIESSMFQPDRLPEEFVTKIWVCDTEGNELAKGTSVLSLREELGQLITSHFEESTGQEWVQSGMKCWEAPALPASIDTPRGSAYPALVDEGTTVGVKVYADEEKAKLSHKEGVIRLYLLECAQHVKYMLKNMPLGIETKMYLPLLGEKGVLIQDVLHLAIEGALGAVLPRDKESFQKSCDQVRGDLHSSLCELAEWLEKMIGSYRRIEEVLESQRGDANKEEIREDIEEEIRWLLRAGFMKQGGWHGIKQYPRYFQAIEERLERLESLPILRDLEKMDRICELWIPWYAYWRESPERPQANSIGFMLEELRVIQFAPNTPSVKKVSTKSVRKKLESLGVIA